jgi:rubrerythrin
MKWICKICGKSIESNERPIACPLCGANGEYIVCEADFKGFPTEIKAKTREDLNAALSLEQNATADYTRYAKECKELGDLQASEMFTALARVEAGHQVSIRKMLCAKVRD